MISTWTVATIVAVVAGVVGFFVVLRGSAFVADALPTGAFAGAAGASLIGVNTLVGLGAFSLLGALAIGWLGRRARHDVAVALALVAMLGLGALFLSFSVEYAPEIYSLLFGEVLGVSSSQILPVALLGGVCISAIVVVYRPLLLSSVVPEVAEAELVSLEDAEAEQQGKKKVAAPEVDVEAEDEEVEVDDTLDDATFIEQEEEGDEDVTDIIGDGIEKEDET